MYLIRGNLFSDTTTDGTIGHSEGNERQQLRTDRDLVRTGKAFVKNVVVMFLALYHIFKSMEPLSFDSPVEYPIEVASRILFNAIN